MKDPKQVLDNDITAAQRKLTAQLTQRIALAVRLLYPEARALRISLNYDTRIFEGVVITGEHGRKLWSNRTGRGKRLWWLLWNAAEHTEANANDVTEDIALWGELALRLDFPACKDRNRIIRFPKAG
jgi:hypothetical protein